MSSIIDLYNSANIRAIDEAVMEMEYNGFMIDTDYCAKGLQLAEADERRVLDFLASTCENLGVTRSNIAEWDEVWSSSQQLSLLLEQQLKIPPSPYKTKGRVDIRNGERSNDKRAIEWMLGKARTSEIKKVLEGIIELRQIRSSAKYLRKLPKFVGPDGFIHPTMGPAGDEDDRVGALTGRGAMKNPEGQQIPKDKAKDKYFIRKAFIAPPGWKLVIADYTALEVVILANIAEILFNDTLLLDLTSPGQDIHAYNAYNVFGRLLNYKTKSGRSIRDFPEQNLYKSDPELEYFRNSIKTIWYKLTYGGTAYSFGMSIKDQNGELLGEKRAQEWVDALYDGCPPLKKWHSYVEQQMIERATITSMDGRLGDYHHQVQRGEWGVKAACRAAGNFPCQAFGAFTIGMAMVSITKCPILRKLGALLQLQIHDENQLRVPAENAEKVAPLLKEHMESAAPIKNLVSTVDVAESWYGKK
jgi:DNA polymerase-1